LLYERAPDIALNAFRAPSPDTPLDQSLLQELARLQSDLTGYPVGALLEVFMGAEDQERLSAHRLVECCLSSWIAELDKPLDPVHGGLPEVFDQIQRRQRGARDALARMQVVLSRAQVVPIRRGQPC